MWKQKISLSVGNRYGVPASEIIVLLKQIGFEAVSLEWDSKGLLSESVKAARECGMELVSLHAPFKKAADLWSWDEKTSSAAKEELLTAAADCVKFHIPTLVVHAWIGFDYRFDRATLNYAAFDEIVAFAQKHGVKIAFENTEGEEYLFALMDRYEKNDTVGFCWDSGHEMCYNRSQDLLEKYGDRLLVTHLNDNLGISRADGTIFWTDDLHLLPFDGIADWEYNVERLKKAEKLEVLNFELNIQSKPNRHENDIYGQMSLEQYLTEVYKRACRIAYRYSR